MRIIILNLLSTRHSINTYFTKRFPKISLLQKLSSFATVALNHKIMYFTLAQESMLHSTVPTSHRESILGQTSQLQPALIINNSLDQLFSTQTQPIVLIRAGLGFQTDVLHLHVCEQRWLNGNDIKCLSLAEKLSPWPISTYRHQWSEIQLGEHSCMGFLRVSVGAPFIFDIY